MPVIALYNFDDADTIAMDSATDNGNQFGYYLNGATAAGGQAVLDGQNDFVKILPSEAFQLDRGTLDIRFTLNSDPLTETQTVLARDSEGQHAGDYRVEILADGSVLISHESATGTVTYQTDAGFANPGDSLSLSYSWDMGGDGGNLLLTNATTGAAFADEVPNTLTMDQGDGEGRPWTVGAGQSHTPDGTVANIDQQLGGSVSMFQISDTVDNNTGGPDGWVDGTSGNDLIDIAYTGDPQGDRIDANDAILPGDAPDDDRVRAGDDDDTVRAGKGDDLVYGGTGNDDLIGNGGDDTLFGEAGNDTLTGSRGDDSLSGGDGADSVTGNRGNDVIDTSSTSGTPLPDRGYPGLYPADADPADDRDTVYGGQGDDTIRTGDDADLINAGQGNDLVDGGFDDDTILGGMGNDTIIGAEGSDSIEAGQGDDLVYGGYGPGVPDAVNIPDDAGDLVPDNGRDFINGAMGNDTIYGMDDDDTVLGGQGDDLLFGGIDDDDVRGGMGNDTVNGDAGNDTLYGDRGDDVLNGGAGTDVQEGGADADTFIIGSAEEGAGDTVYGGAQGNDQDRLDLSGVGDYRLVDVVTDSDGNGIDGTVEFLDADGNVTGSLAFTNIEEIVPCFTPGTLIATPKGEVPVESLRPGDKIVTRDNGLQEVRWIGQKALSWFDLAANPHLKPVLVKAGTLGDGLPERDMMVSPNHRLLVANDRTALYFDEHEVLVSAKHLLSGAGISTVAAAGVTYVHFMCDQHEVVLSNGAWTETFQPGDYTLKGMGNAQRSEIFELFPELKTPAGVDGYQAARRVLKKHEAVLLNR